MGESSDPGEQSQDMHRNLMLSMGRALSHNPTLIERFYEIFLASSPEIKPLFAKTNFDRQFKALSDGISMILMFDKGDPLATDVLTRIRQTHGPASMNIKPAHYRLWAGSLIQALRETDKQLTPELEKEWFRIIEKAIKFILDV